MATHVIIGTGENADIPQAVVNEALKDGLDDKPTVVVGWYGKPEDSLANVYDFLFDQEIDTLLIYDQVEPVKAFREAPNMVVQKVPDMATGFVQEFKDNPGAFMVLGQGDRTDNLLMDVYSKVRPPVVADLADGLAPITMEGFDDLPEVDLDTETRETTLNAHGITTVVTTNDDDPTEDTPTDEVPDVAPGDKPAVLADEDPTDDASPSEEEDPDPFSFNREELLNMPHRVLKRLAAQVMSEEEMPHTSEKEPFVNAIMYAAEALAKEIAGDPDTEVDTAEPYGKATIDGLARDPMGIEDFLLAARNTLRDMNTAQPNRSLAVAVTKVEEALLWWYHYGDKIHFHGGD
jgi:hypothetical protein